MNEETRVLVVTTINPPTGPMLALNEGAELHQISFVIAGDTTTPESSYISFPNFLGVEEQHRRFGRFSEDLPVKHYSRKNLGYLSAMTLGATEIQETDDDNIPYPTFWEPLPGNTTCDSIQSELAWFNVYSLFCSEVVWPRGFPLEEIQKSNPVTVVEIATRALIVQDLADDNPDVDAVYRLTRPLPIRFERRSPVVLAPGVWCPFNSQVTVFRREVFPLLYLPSFCSFRMTDIWRSFVAQKCLWEHGECVMFRSSSVRQERNEHNLLRDFEAEISGYLHNDSIRAVLESLKLAGPDPAGNLIRCYEALVNAGLINIAELGLVRQWCKEVDKHL